jgi:CubicO group peptidase (beta-lactamase class C family)
MGFHLHRFLLQAVCMCLSIHSIAQPVETFSENVHRIISKIDAGEYTNIHGLLVWKDGEIIGEKYWESWYGDSPHNLQSATKSITGILIGIAVKEGFILHR